ncbi:MAG: PIN domain-containing protein [Chloroflexota bacterium]
MPGRVFDTSCIVAQIEDEPGADDVDALLKAGQEAGDAGALSIVIPFIALMEVEYGLLRKYPSVQVERVLLAVQAWPVTTLESSPNWRRAAAAVKARYRLSLADAWVAALALMRDAELVHKSS